MRFKRIGLYSDLDTTSFSVPPLQFIRQFKQFLRPSRQYLRSFPAISPFLPGNISVPSPRFPSLLNSISVPTYYFLRPSPLVSPSLPLAVSSNFTPDRINAHTRNPRSNIGKYLHTAPRCGSATLPDGAPKRPCANSGEQ